jgi:energy-coupling factor transport system ATP-binding protein
MALVATGLSYTYGRGTTFAVPALTDIDVRLERGDLLVIAGQTGSGKSTLLRLLAGLLQPSAGKVLVDDRATSAKAVRGAVSLVFQNPESQFFAESLLADVAFGPRNLGAADPQAQAREALSAVGLDPSRFGERSPFTLSGGEARRGAIAGALAMRAPYLLLDEPTAGLDANARNDVLAAIKAERTRAGVAVVTHDPAEFLPVASHVLALRDGGCAFAGSVDELLAEPDAYRQAGLQLPAVVEVQVLARERGVPLDRIAFEPMEAARLLAGAWGGLR